MSDKKLVDIYKELLLPRLIEERMLLLLRQGKISKWFSGIGQEAISVGATMALQKDEYILPMHRNLGIFTSRGIPLNRLFSQFQGKTRGYTQGRDRSFHFGTKEHHLVGMISHLGPQLSVANGLALSYKLNQERKVVLAITGDGGASEGDFHEALNVASVWDLPVIFLIENNGYGLSTPSIEQFSHQHFIDKGHGYGMEAYQVEGNNVLDMFHAVTTISEEVRKKHRPVLLEALTFRMRGHEEASGTKYVPQKLLDEWSERDPILNYENYLIKEGLLTGAKCEKIKSSIRDKIISELEIAYSDVHPEADSHREIQDMYATHHLSAIQPKDSKTKEMRLVDALANALDLACDKFSQLILMGQDIAEYGGVFKVTEGLYEKYGKRRIRNTPLCESAIIGTGFGLSIAGMKAVIEMQFADFVTCGMTQIVNNLAKSHYRWGQQADVVIRMPTGAGVQAGPFHSQSNESWFFHTPGLKVIYPSSPYDAKGLMLAAIEDPNPVIFFEHKALYRSERGDVPEAYYTLPIGEASRIENGDDLSIITYGMGVRWAKDVAEEFKNIGFDIIDLRSLLPWDKEMVADSVKKTGKVIILHEDTLTGGIGGEIAAYIAEHLFESLDAPVMRVGSLDTAVPFTKKLEDDFLPRKRLIEKIQTLIEY